MIRVGVPARGNQQTQTLHSVWYVNEKEIKLTENAQTDSSEPSRASVLILNLISSTSILVETLIGQTRTLGIL